MEELRSLEKKIEDDNQTLTLMRGMGLAEDRLQGLVSELKEKTRRRVQLHQQLH